jgi:AraC-like DNA-binding protein
VYPAGRVAGGTYHGRVHEFILTIPKKVRAQQDEIPLPATHLIDVWRLIMVLRAELSLETCNKVAKGLIERVLAYIEKPFSPIVTKAIQLLEKNDALRAPEMSNGLGVSASYLCRQFRKNVGVNTTHYSRLLRLNRAAGLLWGTAKPICDIATSCGFSDQPHLSRELMAIFGLSPSFFRQLAPCQRAEHIFLTKQRVVD